MAGGQWNTLRILKTSLYLLWGATALLLLASIAAARIHRNAMKTVGKDTGPSIIAAQHIKSSLADMDANAANELLAQPGKMPEAVTAFEARREEATKAIVTAAENITFGDAERIPIQNLELAMGTYQGLIQRARDLHERNDPRALAAYRVALRLMDRTLLPAVDALDKANADMLDRTYRDQSRTSQAARVTVGITGLALIATLLWTQLFLTVRTRRLLNPALLFATLCAAIFLAYAFWALGTEAHELTVAREDAFKSIHALWRARATAYMARSDESRYLLDDTDAAAHEQAFFANTAKLAKSETGMTFAAIASRAAAGGKLDGFSGYFADELNNLTFPGERETAIDMLFQFSKYYEADRQIRELREAGKREAAIALCIGNGPDQSNWAFTQFDQALGKTLDINQRAFDGSVASGFAALEHFEAKASIMGAFLGVLIFAGLFPRIREYT